MAHRPIVALAVFGSLLVGIAVLRAQTPAPAPTPVAPPAQAGPRLSESVGVAQ